MTTGSGCLGSSYRYVVRPYRIILVKFPPVGLRVHLLSLYVLLTRMTSSICSLASARLITKHSSLCVVSSFGNKEGKEKAQTYFLLVRITKVDNHFFPCKSFRNTGLSTFSYLMTCSGRGCHSRTG